MSYNNYNSFQSSSNHEYSSSEFTRLTNSISSNIQKMNTNVNSMQKYVNQLGTTSDSETLRKQLREVHYTTNQLAKETNNYLKEISQQQQTDNTSDQKQRRMLRDKLTSEFLEVLKNFQVIQRTAAQKEKESVNRARANSGYPPSSSTAEDSNLIDLKSPDQQQQQIHLKIEEDVDLEVLKNREKLIKEIEHDINEINQIFKNLGTIVHDQGEIFDSIEANMESATIHVNEANAQLLKSREYQTRARRRQLILLIILIIFLFILIYFLLK